MRTFRFAVGGLVLLGASCFDSDQKVSQRDLTGSGGGTTTAAGTTGSTTSATTGTSTTAAPVVTCRDAVGCIAGCASGIINAVEPDLSCFLECEEQLTVPEAVKLLRLVNCGGDRCEMIGQCPLPTASSGTSAASGTTGSTTGATTGTGSTTGPDNVTCLTCIFATINDPAPPGCVEEAMACQ